MHGRKGAFLRLSYFGTDRGIICSRFLIVFENVYAYNNIISIYV